jgi:hypothetical protein
LDIAEIAKESLIFSGRIMQGNCTSMIHRTKSSKLMMHMTAIVVQITSKNNGTKSWQNPKALILGHYAPFLCERHGKWHLKQTGEEDDPTIGGLKITHKF